MSLIGIMGAMPEEINKIIDQLTDIQIIERGSRKYYKGILFGQQVVAVFSRWGKVAAATTATNLILEFGVTQIIFTGVAGGLASEAAIGDIVVGVRLYQHDMDARPLMPRLEIPLTGKDAFHSSSEMIGNMSMAVEQFLKSNEELLKRLSERKIDQPKLIVGDIASGDLFISSPKMKQAIVKNIPSAVCAEMEGAAVAQVCDDYNVPLVVVRIISDTADDNAHINAIDFINNFAADYSIGIIKHYFMTL